MEGSGSHDQKKGKEDGTTMPVTFGILHEPAHLVGP